MENIEIKVYGTELDESLCVVSGTLTDSSDDCPLELNSIINLQGVDILPSISWEEEKEWRYRTMEELSENYPE